MSQARDTRSSGTGPSARIGYTRVSTVSQTFDQQNAALEAAGVTKTFSDTPAELPHGRHPGLAALMEYVCEGDTVVVWKLDRLAATHCTSWRQSRLSLNVASPWYRSLMASTRPLPQGA
jgi:DNA invertase Pin-like site-specific DNA recombinase